MRLAGELTKPLALTNLSPTFYLKLARVRQAKGPESGGLVPPRSKSALIQLDVLHAAQVFNLNRKKDDPTEKSSKDFPTQMAHPSDDKDERSHMKFAECDFPHQLLPG